MTSQDLPIHHHCSDEKPNISHIKYFLDEDIKEGEDSLKVQNRMGNTPLMCAIKYHNFDIAEFLLSKGATINGPMNTDGKRPIHLLFDVLNNPQEYDQEDCEAAFSFLSLVLEQEILDFDQKDGEQKSLDKYLLASPALESFLSKGYEVRAEEELDYIGRTALHIAAVKGLPYNVAYLLEKGFDPYRKCRVLEMTPFQYSVFKNEERTITEDHLACAKLFVEAGVPFNFEYDVDSEVATHIKKM